MFLGIMALIFSVLAFAIAAFALIEVKAMQRSTHRITMFDPSKQDFQALTEAEKKAMMEPINDDF